MIEPTRIPVAPADDELTRWLRKLGRELDARAPAMRRAEAYCHGDHPLAFVSDKFRQVFGRRFPHLAANFMELVVDAHRERLHVQGVRIGEEREGDRDAWAWWQDNRLDSESQKAHAEALTKSAAYALVWPEGDAPEVTIEDGLQVVVDVVPGKTWRRRAALKRWIDEDRGRLVANLYLPDGIYKFESEQATRDFSVSDWPAELGPDRIRWRRRDVAGESWPVWNRLGVVPIVPLVNRPDLVGRGQSEIAAVISNQDAINFYRAGAIVAAEYVAYPQRYALNLDVQVDADGNPIEPFKAGAANLWVVSPPEDPDDSGPPVQLGQFPAASIEQYFKAIESEMTAIASITRTPYHYFLQHGGQPPSGESLRSAEIGLVAKVRDSMLHQGQGWEEVFRLNYLWRGDSRGNISGYEIIWRDPEYRTESEHVDALVKLRTLGVPLEVLWEKLPASPTEIARWRVMAQEEALEAAISAPPVTTPRTGIIPTPTDGIPTS